MTDKPKPTWPTKALEYVFTICLGALLLAATYRGIVWLLP